VRVVIEQSGRRKLQFLRNVLKLLRLFSGFQHINIQLLTYHTALHIHVLNVHILLFCMIYLLEIGVRTRVHVFITKGGHYDVYSSGSAMHQCLVMSCL